jgi:hypothetical protein
MSSRLKHILAAVAVLTYAVFGWGWGLVATLALIPIGRAIG